MKFKLFALTQILLSGVIVAAVYPISLVYAFVVDSLFGDQVFLSIAKFGDKSEILGIVLQDWKTSLPYAFVVVAAVVASGQINKKYFSGNYLYYFLVSTLIASGVGISFFGAGSYFLAMGVFVAISISSIYYLGIRITERIGRAGE